MAKETAESKLLKLIEETDAKDKTGAPAGTAPAPAAAQVLDSVSSVSVGSISLPPFLQNIFSMFSAGSRSSQGFGLRQANQLLFLAIIGVAIFLIKDFSVGMKVAEQDVNIPVKPMPFDERQVAVPAPPAVEKYVSTISYRNIFRPFEKKVEEEVKITAPVENQKIKDKVANFKLVGISWLNSPETATVMIEDKSTTVTHFLKTGEALQGVQIQTIYADRVEMNFQGEKLMMNL